MTEHQNTGPGVPAIDPVFIEFCDAGLWPGLGRTLAAELPAAGIRRPDDVTASKLADLPRVGTQRAGRLLSSFIAAAPAYELVELCLQAKIETRTAGRLVDTFGPAAPRLLRDDPWISLAVQGLAIGDADRLAIAALPGVQRDDPRRSRALVAHVLTLAAREGHTLVPSATVGMSLRAFGVGDPAVAIEAALSGGQVLAIEDEPVDGGPDGPPADDATEPEVLLGLERYVLAEDLIAQGIARLLATAEPVAMPAKAKLPKDLDADQRAAVANAMRSGVSLLVGGPGTGKSHTVASIVMMAEQRGMQVALAAPTGRAAKRLGQLCDAPATTLHRLLGAQVRRVESDPDGDTADAGRQSTFVGEFARGEEWPLDEDLIVVDETSMLDVELAAALLAACADGTHLVIVGDPAQLPSIGPGRVLADLLASDIAPVTELRTLYRQAEGGAIARLATAVRAGELATVESPDREVVIVAARGSLEAAKRVVQLVTDSIPRALKIPADQIQVVTPVHRGPAGTAELNAALKAALNPAPAGKSRATGAARFDTGDRVVATANHPEAEPNGYANGEVGTVLSSVDGVVTVEFDSGPAHVRGKMLVDLTHGWAITVHRAQGSEFPAVVAVLPPEAGGMLSRPLVYTALTRAQRHLSIVHASGPQLARSVRDIGAKPRRTRLVELLHEYADSVTMES